jgi:tetratricopeptide (TPR) repeat protein
MMKNEVDRSPAEIPEAVKKGIRARLSRNAGPCPDSSLLERYAAGALSGSGLKRIQNHLAGCPACVAAVRAIIRTEAAGEGISAPAPVWEAVEKRMDREFGDQLKNAAVPGPQSGRPAAAENRTARPNSMWRDAWDAVLRPRPLAAAAVVATLVLAGSYSAAYLSRGPYFDLARVRPERLPRLRAVESEGGFDKAMRRYSLGDYSGAIALFDAILGSEPDRFAARYYLGLSHLARAESGLPGLAFRFDGRDVAEGIGSLETALALAGDNARFRAECYWYLGKAGLMQGRKEEAAACFGRILELEGADPSQIEAARGMQSRIR